MIKVSLAFGFLSIFSKMHERKHTMVLLKFIHSAVWELHLDRKPCIAGECFILFQLMVGTLHFRETRFGFLTVGSAPTEKLSSNEIHINMDGMKI